MTVLHHTPGPACPECDVKLTEAHDFMAEWFRRKKAERPMIHVSWSYRGPEDQEEAVRNGKSEKHFPYSKHNVRPSIALDLFVLSDEGVAQFPMPLFAKINQENELAREPIRWGGKWKHLGDGCHFQYSPPAEATEAP